MRNLFHYLITTALLKYWRTEIMPPATTQPLAPIRFYGDPNAIYLA